MHRWFDLQTTGHRATRAALRCATTTHEDSAVYTVSTSSFTMLVEAVTHALRWITSSGDSRITHAIVLTDSVSLLRNLKVEWEALTGMSRWSTSALWAYCPENAGMEGNDRVDAGGGRGGGPTPVAYVLECLNC